MRDECRKSSLCFASSYGTACAVTDEGLRATKKCVVQCLLMRLFPQPGQPATFIVSLGLETNHLNNTKVWHPWRLIVFQIQAGSNPGTAKVESLAKPARRRAARLLQLLRSGAGGVRLRAAGLEARAQGLEPWRSGGGVG